MGQLEAQIATKRFVGRDGRVAYGGALLRRWCLHRVGSNPTPSAVKAVCFVARSGLDGWPSGLRRTIGNRVDIVRVGSNPTPSVCSYPSSPGCGSVR